MSDFSRLLSGFSQSFGCPSTGVFLRLVPPRFTFLVGDWSSSMALLLPGRLPPPLSLALAGAFSLALGLPPSSCGCSCLGCPLLWSWCRFSLSPGLLLLGVSCSFFSWVPGCFDTQGSMLSLQFCFLPGVPVLLVHGFHLDFRVSLSFIPSRLSGYDLRFPFCNSFSSYPLPGILGIWLPCLLSLPFQRFPLLSVLGAWSACLVFRLFVSFLGLPSSLLLQFVTSFPSFGALLTLLNLRFTTRRSLPLGRVCFWFNLLARPVHWSFLCSPSSSAPSTGGPFGFPFLLGLLSFW